jgi:PKD repeat protein
VTDSGSPAASGTYNVSMTVENAPPIANFSYTLDGGNLTLALTNPADSAADLATGFTYAFDCGDGSGYGSFDASASHTCAAFTGTHTVKGKIRDKDGGVSEYTFNLTFSRAAPLARWRR